METVCSASATMNMVKATVLSLPLLVIAGCGTGKTISPGVAATTAETADMPAPMPQSAQVEKNVAMGLRNGQISIDGKMMTPEEAAVYLNGLQLGRRSNEARVVIISSAGQNYQLLHRAMAMIEAAGGIVCLNETAVTH